MVIKHEIFSNQNLQCARQNIKININNNLSISFRLPPLLADVTDFLFTPSSGSWTNGGLLCLIVSIVFKVDDVFDPA